MAGSRLAGRTPSTRLAGSILAPVLIVALVLASAVLPRLHLYDGNATGFVKFGHAFVRYTRPPRGAIVDSPYGYDGQFFWLQARDPLLLHDSTLARMRAPHNGFRLQRVAYPAFAALLAGGQAGALPWSMLALNIFVVLALTAGFACYARARGWPVGWAVVMGLIPGLVLGVLRDLSDPLAVAAVLGGLMLWERNRRWGAGALLALAALAREPMMLGVVAVAVDVGARWWRARRESGTLRNELVRAAPTIGLPVVAFVAWQVYVDIRFGADAATTASGAFVAPATNVVDEVRHAVDAGGLTGAWDLVYLALMVAAIFVALWLVTRRVDAFTVTAALFALTLPLLTFGDAWAYARYSAPVLGALLLAGLGMRARVPLGLCVAAPVLTVLIPVSLGG